MTGESIKHRFSKNQHQKIDIQSIASAVFLSWMYRQKKQFLSFACTVVLTVSIMFNR